MATTTSKQLQQSQFSTPQEALTPIIGTGHQMVYEAKWALEQLRGQSQIDQEQLLEIVETFSKSIGWVEALVFAQTTNGSALAQFGGNNQQGRQ